MSAGQHLQRADLLGEVVGLYVGRARQLWPDKAASGIAKEPVVGPLQITLQGCTGDEQADLENHGGVDKAVHHYPAEHYALWKDELGEVAADFGPGRFGENICSRGLIEADLCIGDVIGMGEAVFEVSQGREPCWKLAEHTSYPRMALLVRKTLRTGWYYRIKQAGTIRIGDSIRLVERRHADWAVDRVTRARFDARLDPAAAGELVRLPELAESWREGFDKKAGRKSS